MLVMRRRVFTILSAASLLLCVTTVALWVRSWALNGYSLSAATGFGGSDYYERSSKNISPPARGDNWANWNEEQWQKWTAEFERWDRQRWIIHVRANPDAIFVFGRQPFYGYPRNWFGLHLYYWALI